MVEATHCDPRTYPLLSQIGTPADLRALPPKQLGEVCRELREYLINTVATRGGHFAAFEQPELFVDDLRTFFRLLR